MKAKGYQFGTIQGVFIPSILTILGEAYSKYYEQLLKNIEPMPAVALVLASEQVDFNRIFQLRG